MAKTPYEVDRPIRAVFYEDFKATKAIKINRGKHPEKMVQRCHAHMRKNTYGAVLAEVFNENTGKLHSQVKRKINGDLEIHFEREYKEGDKI